MKIEVGDIVIAEVAKSDKYAARNVLKVTEVVSDAVFVGIALLRGAKTEHRMDTLKVLANLGKDPKDGWVYGITISGGFEGSDTVEGIDMMLKTKMPEGMREAIENCLVQFKRVFDLLQFNIEIHPIHRKRLGFWKTFKRGGTDTMGIHVTAFHEDE